MTSEVSLLKVHPAETELVRDQPHFVQLQPINAPLGGAREIEVAVRFSF